MVPRVIKRIAELGIRVALGSAVGDNGTVSPSRTIFSVGHSNVSLDEFLELLVAHGIEAVADVRSYPRSRRHPHFGRESLSAALTEHGVDYRWFPALGGRRQPRTGSPHTGWQVPGFRAYADHMDTGVFGAALAEMLTWAGQRRVAVLCAERLWWQCHRRLLSDRLTADGWRVEHLLTPTRRETHRMTEFLRIEDGRLIYDLVLSLDS
jgi:uncharacterized protein (DUF488 family)